MIVYHAHIRSTDEFKQIGVREKMTEIRTTVWRTTAFGYEFAQP